MDTAEGRLWRITRAFSLIAGGALLFFAARFALAGHVRVPLVEVSAAIGIGLTWFLSGAPGNPARARLAFHVVVGLIFAAFFLVAMLTGQGRSLVPFWSALLPWVATYALGPRGGLPWAVVCVVQTLVIHASGRFWPIEPEFLPRSAEWLSVQAGLAVLGSLVGTAAFRAQASELRLAAEREAAMRREAEVLADARDAALAAVRAKEEFLAVVTHELRNPIHGLLGLAQLLSESRLSRDQADLVEHMVGSGESLLGLVNDILDHSRFEAGALALSDGLLDVRALVDDAVAVVAPDVTRRGLTLVARVDPRVPVALRGDSLRLRQIVVNLVANAVKFTEQGRVRVVVEPGVACGDGASSDAVPLSIRVEDTGIGIPAAQLAAIFEPFVQADASTTRRYGGSGLGLSIARRLAGLMGGGIDVTSKEGEGTRFTVRVVLERSPATPASRPVPPLFEGRTALLRLADEEERAAITDALVPMGVTIADTDGSSVDVVLVDGASSGASLPGVPCVYVDAGPDESVPVVRRPVRSSRLAAALGRALGVRVRAPDGQDSRPGTGEVPMNVLVVDDTPINRMIAERILTRMGHHVEVAEGGHDALGKVASSDLDVVLLDVRMPDMDGREVAARLVAARGGRSRPVIIGLSANAGPEDVKSALDAGMDAFVAKPLVAADLARALSMASERIVLAAMAASAAMPPPVREPRVMLAEMRDLLGVADTRELAREFLTAAAQLVEHVVQRAEDRDLVVRSAHRLKGTASTFGASRVGALAGTIERSGAAPADEIARLGAELSRALADERDEIERVLCELLFQVAGRGRRDHLRQHGLAAAHPIRGTTRRARRPRRTRR